MCVVCVCVCLDECTHISVLGFAAIKCAEMMPLAPSLPPLIVASQATMLNTGFGAGTAAGLWLCGSGSGSDGLRNLNGEVFSTMVVESF